MGDRRRRGKLAMGIVIRVNDAAGGVEVGTHRSSRGVLDLVQ